jgi:methionine-rich copper-binding protein CopC
MMTFLPLRHPVRPVVALSVALLMLVALLAPTAVLGHAELDTSDPADGASVEGPYAGPILLTFTEDLEAESNAVLRDGAGVVAATSVVDGATITLTPAATLAEGEYEVRWESFADDGHLERGTFRFTVLPAPTPEPTASPTPTPDATASPTTEPTASAEGTPSASPAASDAPTPSAAPDPDGTSSGSDVLLPIIVAVVIVGGLAAFLLRRRDSTTTPS